MKIVTPVEAQNRFGELRDNAQREPVTTTRCGRTVAFLLSPEDMKDLLATAANASRHWRLWPALRCAPLLVSLAALAELEQVLMHEKLDHYLDRETSGNFLVLHCSHARLFPRPMKWPSAAESYSRGVVPDSRGRRRLKRAILRASIHLKKLHPPFEAIRIEPMA